MINKGAKIKCVNQEGKSLTFSDNIISPFILVSADGLYDIKSDVNMSDNAMAHGATYLDSYLQTRNIVLTLRDYEEKYYLGNRELLDNVFRPGQEGTLYYYEKDVARKINYYFENLTFSGNGPKRNYQLSLLCPDPFFYDENSVSVVMAAYQSAFEFAHEFKAEKEVFGYREKESIKDIINDNGEDETGMRLHITCTGKVTNPAIVNILTQERIQIGSPSKSFSMNAGDELLITTEQGNKRILLIRDGVETNINNYLTEDSVFLQLHKGDNNIGYTADSGMENMIIEITYEMRYLSA